MRIPILIISAASLITLGGIAKADDHLYQALQGGLGKGPAADNAQVFTTNSAGYSGDLAPGRGSPFTSLDPSGEDLGTPSVGVDRLNPQAQDKVPFGE
jgi:hypothetical protein